MDGAGPAKSSPARSWESPTGPFALSRKECLVPRHLISEADTVCPRERLLAAVWAASGDAGSNVVDAYVRWLRTRLGADYIETVRDAGYRFRPA